MMVLAEKHPWDAMGSGLELSRGVKPALNLHRLENFSLIVII